MEFYHKNFQRLREGRGLTLAEIGDSLQVAKQTVQKWDKGKVRPHIKRIREIAKLLQCSVYDISNIQPDPGDPCFALSGDNKDMLLSAIVAHWEMLDGAEQARVAGLVSHLLKEKHSATVSGPRLPEQGK